MVYWREQMWLSVVSGGLALLFFVLGFRDKGRHFATKSREEIPDDTPGRAKQLILLNEDDQEISSWDISGRTSLVIGRDAGENQVDINLAGATYAGFVDIEHAVLNYAGGCWHIEDLHSENGVKVQKIGDPRHYKLATDKPCRLDVGDTIYIAQTKLQLR